MSINNTRSRKAQTGTGTASSWDQENPNTSSSEQDTMQSTNGTISGGLAGLFGLTSMTSDNRNLKEVADTMKLVTELYEGITKSTTNETQRAIIPVIETLTSSISPLLPGLGFHRVIGGTLYVMAALFSNRNLTLSSERITIQGGNNMMSQQVSIPVAPASYINKQFLENLKDHYTRYAESKGIATVAIINALVVDLEMMNHPEAGEPKDYPHVIAAGLASEWEESLLVKAAQEFQASSGKTPTPFKDPKQPYGKDSCAEARVTAIDKRTTKFRTLTASNMEVTATTINSINNLNNSNFNANNREICRASAIVSLVGMSWEEHQRILASMNGRDQSQLAGFLGMGAMGSIYPAGYKPLRPVITIEDVQAGEMLNNNGGLYPYFYGLFLLMTTNNNHVFMEAIRRHTVGCRGNLSALETRITQMLAQSQGGAMVNNPQRIILDDKKISDTELVNMWIRQNVATHATFHVNLIPSGPHASITNFLFRLADKNNTSQVKTVVAIIDSMTNNKMSEIIARNIVAANAGTPSGWTPNKPVLIPTPTLVPNGLADLGGKKLNTQELDEMMICNVKGKSGGAAIEAFLGTQYGVNPNEDYKQRSQKLRIELSQSIFDGYVHLNGFAQTHIWAPDFMAALGEAMDSIGNLSVSNTLGSFRTTNMVYAMGGGLATMVGAGNNNVGGQMGVNFSIGAGGSIL